MNILNFLSSVITILTFILTFGFIPDSSATLIFKLGLPEKVVIFSILMFSVLSAVSSAVQHFSKLKPMSFLTPVCILAIVNAYVIMRLAEILILQSIDPNFQFIVFMSLLAISIVYSSVSISGKLSNRFLFSERGKYSFSVNCIFNGAMLIMFAVIGQSISS